MRGQLEMRTVTTSGLFDRQWYEAQIGKKFDSVRAAAQHYLTSGRSRGLSPHPFFEPAAADPDWRTATVDPFVAELRNTPIGRPHLLLDFVGNDEHGRSRWVSWARSLEDAGRVGLRYDSPASWRVVRDAAIDSVRAQCRDQRLAAATRPSKTRPADGTAPSPVDPDGAPLVSVAAVTWNDAQRLRNALTALRKQTLTSWELIVVDNGSDDDTALVLQGIASRDTRVRVVSVDHVGEAAALNLALSTAAGRYVAFLDRDVAWFPEFLSVTVGTAEADRLDWAHAAMQTRRLASPVAKDGPGPTDGASPREVVRYSAFSGTREHLLVSEHIDLHVTLVRRSAFDALGGFDESLGHAFGYDLLLRLAARSAPRLVPVLGGSAGRDAERERQRAMWRTKVQVRHLLADLAAVEPDLDRVSIVVPVRGDAAWALHVLDELVRTAAGAEIVLVGSGLTADTGRVLALAVAAHPDLRLVTWPLPLSLAAAADLGSAHAIGGTMVVWGANCLPIQGWIEPLLAAMADPGVALAQPLHMRSDGRIASAGAVFVDGDVLPTPLLEGMPSEDVSTLSVDVVPAALGQVVALRTADFRAAGGFDPLFGNAFGETALSLRLRESGAGMSVLVTASTVIARDPARVGFAPDVAASLRVLRNDAVVPPGSAQLWDRVGFQVLGRRVLAFGGKHKDGRPASDEGPGVELGAVPVVRPRVHERPGRLRWSIDVAAPLEAVGGEREQWRFARSLAAALERLGQQVHVDSRVARHSDHRDLDDITLVLRGADEVRPRPGARSILWVVTHPELVTGPEAAAYDRVFTASESWAARSAKRWNLAVDPLLQCTDRELFGVRTAEPDTGEDVVFVGDSQGVRRFAVAAALDAGIPLAVYGQGWDNLVPAAARRYDRLDDAHLCRLYAGAGAVLVDHRDDMRHNGFISHQVFDVLAAGGRLVSDHVAGLTDLFGTSVPVFDSPHDVRRLFDGDWRSRFPDAERRRALSETVRKEHSFDARATTLLDTALRLSRGGGRAEPLP